MIPNANIVADWLKRARRERESQEYQQIQLELPVKYGEELPEEAHSGRGDQEPQPRGLVIIDLF